MDEVPQGGAGGVPLDDDSQESRRRRPHPSPARETERAADRARSRSTAGRDSEGGDTLTPNTEAQEETAREGRKGKDPGAH